MYNSFLGLVVTFESLPLKLDINDVNGIIDEFKLNAYHLLPEYIQKEDVVYANQPSLPDDEAVIGAGCQFGSVYTVVVPLLEAYISNTSSNPKFLLINFSELFI